MTDIPEFAAIVSQRDRLWFTKDERRGFDMWLASLRGQSVYVTVQKQEASLSARQRKWYFGGILKQIHKQTGQDKDELHLYFKDRLLGSPEHKLVVLVDGDGRVVDERDCSKDQSITVLSTRKMARYCDDIRQIAAAELRIDIPEPDVSWRLKANV